MKKLSIAIISILFTSFIFTDVFAAYRSVSRPSYRSSSNGYNSSSTHIVTPSKPVTKRATINSSGTPSYRKLTSTSDLSSWFSFTHLVLMYLLISPAVHSANSNSAISDTDKQRIIDEYNKDPDKYEDKLAACGDSQSTVYENKDIILKNNDLSFYGLEKRKTLLGGSGSILEKFDTKTPVYIEFVQYVDTDEFVKNENGCLGKKTMIETYKYGTKSNTSKDSLKENYSLFSEYWEGIKFSGLDSKDLDISMVDVIFSDNQEKIISFQKNETPFRKNTDIIHNKMKWDGWTINNFEISTNTGIYSSDNWYKLMHIKSVCPTDKSETKETFWVLNEEDWTINVTSDIFLERKCESSKDFPELNEWTGSIKDTIKVDWYYNLFIWSSSIPTDNLSKISVSEYVLQTPDGKLVGLDFKNSYWEWYSFNWILSIFKDILHIFS